MNRFALRELSLELSVRQLERAFDFSRKTVRRVLTNELEPKQRGRHNALPDDPEAKIMAWIIHQAGKSQSVTRTDILHGCAKNFGQSITRGSVDSFIGRHMTGSMETTSSPEEVLFTNSSSFPGRHSSADKRSGR
jgi:hypothetical protein